jgi:hypothetical protein
MWKSFLLLFAVFFFIPTITYANGAGLPAFFMINGKTAIPNPLQTFGITSQSFLIPQDYAPERYEVNKPISFSIDKTVLQTVITPDFLQNTKFMWDFGDGAKAEGYDNTHVYTKKGTYILVLTINVYVNPGDPPTQFIDSYLINVLPDQNYKGLPQAIIKVNGEQVTSNTKKLVNANFANEIIFDATDSKSSAPIVAYLWNFGDGQTSTSPKVTHTYKDQYFDTVVLRVRDKNGFFSDSFIGLKDDKTIHANPVKSTKTNQTSANVFLISILGGLIIVGGIMTSIIRKRRK